MPLRQRGAGELEPVASEDALLSVQRLMVAPTLDDRLGEQARTRDALGDGQG